MKQDRIMLKFALPWLTLAGFTLIFSISANFAQGFTNFVGFENPANVYLSIVVGALVALSILLSAEVTKSVKRLEKAARAIAITDGNVSAK